MTPEPIPSLDFDRTISRIRDLDDEQLSAGEYLYLAELVLSRSPCRFLVFGVGNDSGLWMMANPGGQTAFLESSALWSTQVRWRHPEIVIHGVVYGTERRLWRRMLDGPEAALALDLPDEVAAERWDVIFVDAPASYADSCPGRMKSIYTAADLAHRHPGTDVVIHDCDRPLERAYCDRFLPRDLLVRRFERTRHYRSRGSLGEEEPAVPGRFARERAEVRDAGGVLQALTPARGGPEGLPSTSTKGVPDGKDQEE